MRKLRREHRSQRTGNGRGDRQGRYSFCCMSGRDFATRCRKVGSMQKYPFETWQEETLRHGVVKSERGRMIYIYKAVQQEYILPPIRAEPMVERKQLIAQRKSYKNKKERINQIGKGEPSVDTGGFLFVQDKEFIHFWFWFQDKIWHFLHQQSES